MGVKSLWQLLKTPLVDPFCTRKHGCYRVFLLTSIQFRDHGGNVYGH